MYDSRLFNQTGGLDQGFGAEDSYTVYDKAMGKGDAVCSGLFVVANTITTPTSIATTTTTSTTTSTTTTMRCEPCRVTAD